MKPNRSRPYGADRGFFRTDDKACSFGRSDLSRRQETIWFADLVVLAPESNKESQMNEQTPQSGLEVATLGGGCFWCLEPLFKELRGVDSAVSGYAGGTVENPSYEAVCSGRTGHAEVVQITFDPSIISFKDLLTVFFTYHDPTTLNRQGNDVGTQYRSVVFCHDEAQKAMGRSGSQRN